MSLPVNPSHNPQMNAQYSLKKVCFTILVNLIYEVCKTVLQLILSCLLLNVYTVICLFILILIHEIIGLVYIDRDNDNVHSDIICTVVNYTKMNLMISCIHLF